MVESFHFALEVALGDAALEGAQETVQFLDDVVLQVVDAEQLLGPGDVFQQGLLDGQHLFGLGVTGLYVGMVESDELVLEVLDIGRGYFDVL